MLHINSAPTKLVPRPRTKTQGFGPELNFGCRVLSRVLALALGQGLEIIVRPDSHYIIMVCYMPTPRRK